MRTLLLTPAQRLRLKQRMELLIEETLSLPQYLRGLGMSIRAIQEDIHAIRDQQEAQRQSNNVPSEPSILRAELRVPEENERAKQANSDRNYRLQILLTVGTWLAFLAAAIYAGIAESTRRATVEAVNQAKRANDLQDRLVKGTYGAIYEAQAELTDGTINLTFTNTGKVASAKVKAITRITPESTPDYKPMREPQTIATDGAQIAPGRLAQTLKHLDGFTQGDTDRLARWQEAVAIEGTIVYDNGFGDTVSSRFCFLNVRWATGGDHELVVRPLPCDTAKEQVRIGPGMLRNDQRAKKKK